MQSKTFDMTPRLLLILKVIVDHVRDQRGKGEHALYRRNADEYELRHPGGNVMVYPPTYTDLRAAFNDYIMTLRAPMAQLTGPPQVREALNALAAMNLIASDVPAGSSQAITLKEAAETLVEKLEDENYFAAYKLDNPSFVNGITLHVSTE